MGGLEFVAGCLHEEQDKRLLRKILTFMYDLVLNDDGILVNDPQACRKTYGTQMNVVDRLLNLLEVDSQVLSDPQATNLLWDNREFNLRILFRVFQVVEDTYKEKVGAIKAHLDRLIVAIKNTTGSDQDKREMLSKEMELAQKVLVAP